MRPQQIKHHGLRQQVGKASSALAMAIVLAAVGGPLVHSLDPDAIDHPDWHWDNPHPYSDPVDADG